MKRVAVTAAVAMATLLLAVLLWKLRGAALLFLVSLAAAAAMRPFVDGLEARGLPRTLALALSYTVALGVVAALALLVGRAVVDELEPAADLLGAAYDRWRARASGFHPVPDLLLRRLPPAGAVLGAVSGHKPEVLARQALGVTLDVVDVIGRGVIVVALSAYWTASRGSFGRLWMSLLPAPRRARARDVWGRVEEGVGAHLRSEIGQSLAIVLMLAGVFEAVGLPVAILPALVAGLARLVPLVGGPFGVAAAFLAGAMVRLDLGFIAGAVAAASMLALDRLVVRRFGHARPVSGTLVVLMVVGLADAYGILALPLAAPLAAAVQIFLERMLATQPGRVRRAGRLSEIEHRIARLRRALGRLEPERSSEVASLVARLERAAADVRDLPEMTPLPERQGGAAWELSPSTPMIGDRHGNVDTRSPPPPGP